MKSCKYLNYNFYLPTTYKLNNSTVKIKTFRYKQVSKPIKVGERFDFLSRTDKINKRHSYYTLVKLSSTRLPVHDIFLFEAEPNNNWAVKSTNLSIICRKVMLHVEYSKLDIVHWPRMSGIKLIYREANQRR